VKNPRIEASTLAAVPAKLRPPAIARCRLRRAGSHADWDWRLELCTRSVCEAARPERVSNILIMWTNRVGVHTHQETPSSVMGADVWRRTRERPYRRPDRPSRRRVASCVRSSIDSASAPEWAVSRAERAATPSTSHGRRRRRASELKRSPRRKATAPGGQRGYRPFRRDCRQRCAI